MPACRLPLYFLFSSTLSPGLVFAPLTCSTIFRCTFRGQLLSSRCSSKLQKGPKEGGFEKLIRSVSKIDDGPYSRSRFLWPPPGMSNSLLRWPQRAMSKMALSKSSKGQSSYAAIPVRKWSKWWCSMTNLKIYGLGHLIAFTVFENTPKCLLNFICTTYYGCFHLLFILTTGWRASWLQINVARFARNVENETFLRYFQTLCLLARFLFQEFTLSSG
mgnify:CR=1 FL=1